MVSYMDFSGPGSTHMYHFAGELSSMGHDLFLTVYGDPQSVELMHKAPEFPVRKVEFDDLFMKRSLVRELSEFRPQIVHLWTPRNVPSRVGLELKYRFGTRIVIHYEDDEDYLVRYYGEGHFETFEDMLKDLRDPGNWPWKVPVFSTLANRYADCFTAICPAFIERLKRQWGKEAHLLYPGVDTDRFSPDAEPTKSSLPFETEGRRLLLYSGSIGAVHEFPQLLQTVHILKKKRPEVLLLHIGRNLIRDETDRLIRELDLQNNVIFLGPVEHRKIHAYLALGEILLQSGRPGEFNRYRLPSKLPEYLAMGKPVVCFHEGIGREFADRKHVLKTYTSDPEEMAEKIEELLDDATLRKTLSENSRAKAVELFNWRRNAGVLAKVYRDVLDGKYNANRSGMIRNTDPVTAPPISFSKPRLSVRTISKILIVAPDMPPFEGAVTSGAGLRAWSFQKSLEEAGFHTLLSAPEPAARHYKNIPSEIKELMFDPQHLEEKIARVDPDLVLFCHWPMLNLLKEKPHLPTVLDLAGPHFLERTYLPGMNDFQQNRLEKIRALRSADYFTCAGEKQKAYFISWLIAAGFDPSQINISVIPISFPPELPSHKEKLEEITVVYSGIFLPWQDPAKSLRSLIRVMMQENKGRLLFFGGLHPHHNVDPGIFTEFIKELKDCSRVDLRKSIPYNDLIEILPRAHAAVDLMSRNLEREISFNVRTVMYLWCGLPVIYNDYSELSPRIQDYDAGWILDPEDEKGQENVFRRVLNDAEERRSKSINAGLLAKNELNWRETMKPLIRYCRNPLFAETKKTWNAQLETIPENSHDMARLKSMLREKEHQLDLKENHIRNLEHFRNKITDNPFYRLYVKSKTIKQRIKRP